MKNFRGLAWRITDEKIAGQGARVRLLIRLCRRRDKKYAGLLILEVIRSGFAEVRNDMMHHRAVGRPHFEHLHPLVFLEASRNDDILIVDHAGGRNGKRLWQLKNHIRLGNAPPLDKLVQRRWHILRIAFLGAAVHPSNKRADRRRRECPLIREVPVLRIGVPRRHDLLRDDHFDHGGPRLGVLIGQHRERRSLAWPVAGLAVLLQNGRDVLGKRGRWVVRFLGAHIEKGANRKGQQNR